MKFVRDLRQSMWYSLDTSIYSANKTSNNITEIMGRICNDQTEFLYDRKNWQLIGRSSSSREKYACCRIISGFTDRSSEKSTSYQTCIVIGKEGIYLNGIFRYT
jgi:hypothetical protein